MGLKQELFWDVSALCVERRLRNHVGDSLYVRSIHVSHHAIYLTVWHLMWAGELAWDE